LHRSLASGFTRICPGVASAIRRLASASGLPKSSGKVGFALFGLVLLCVGAVTSISPLTMAAVGMVTTCQRIVWARTSRAALIA